MQKKNFSKAEQIWNFETFFQGTEGRDFLEELFKGPINVELLKNIHSSLNVDFLRIIIFKDQRTRFLNNIF